jgi:serine/threonine protein kinase
MIFRPYLRRQLLYQVLQIRIRYKVFNIHRTSSYLRILRAKKATRCLDYQHVAFPPLYTHSYTSNYDNPRLSLTSYCSATEPIRAIRSSLKGHAHLHKLGYLHRDISPHNILLPWSPSSTSSSSPNEGFPHALSKIRRHALSDFNGEAPEMRLGWWVG